MTRRRLVVLASAVALLAIGLVAALAVVSVTQTSFGRERLRRFLVEKLASQVHGRIYIGRIGGSLLTGVTIDSLEIRDADDSLFVATGRVTVEYDPRDLIDRRILVRRFEAEHPIVHLRRDSTDEWNFRKIFPPGPEKPRRTAQRGFGDYIVIDSTVIRGGAFLLTMPWEPDESLQGARRDSAVAHALARTDKEIRRAGGGFLRTWRWTELDAALSYVRIADPDSVGRLFAITSLAVNESDPPFTVRDVRGAVRLDGDSLWIEAQRFRLAGSTGRGHGKLVWGSDLPVRYDLSIVGDSVSLSDVAWVYPTLPTTGGGSMVLTIRNSPLDLEILDYALSDMDVRTTKSRLRGKMTFGVGGDTLVVKDLDLEAAPVDFDLIRTLAGHPFPYDWQGQLVGTVRGRGGPLDRFRVDDAALTFRDAHVRGAVSRLSGRGELDIFEPADPVFRGFRVDAQQVDLRTLQFLNPEFPRLGGTIAGRATLDSSWLDVRFRDADLTHRDGPAEPSRVLGNGRVTWGADFLRYDLALAAAPLSFTTLARSYPALPVRGAYAGPLRIEGTLADLLVTADLAGPAGRLAFDGRVDAHPAGYRLQGTGHVARLDLRTLLDTTAVPATELTARFSTDLAGDSLTNLAGSLVLDLDRSLVDSVRVYPSYAQLGFGAGRMRVDSLFLETAAATLVARGGLGLARGTSDSLHYAVRLDSLGGLRRYLGARTAAADGGALAPHDSLGGTVTATGVATGNLDSLTASAAVIGEGLWRRGDRVDSLSGHLDLALVDRMLRWQAALRLDTAVVSGVRLAQASISARAERRDLVDFTVNATSATGPQALLAGNARLTRDTTLVTIDSLRLDIGDNRWRLAAPGRILADAAGLAIDSLVLLGPAPAEVRVAGTVPKAGAVALGVRANGVPLADIGSLRQAQVPFAGTVSLAADVAGTRDDPTMRLEGMLTSPRFGEVHLDRITASGRYAARRMQTTVDLIRGGTTALNMTAVLPVDLSLRTVTRRQLDEPLTGKIRSDSVDFGIVEAFTSAVRGARGKFIANLDVGGTLARPLLTGNLAIANGEMTPTALGKVRFTGINADLRFFGDSVAIQRLAMRSGDQRGDTLSVKGGVSVANYDDPRFDVQLHASNFHAIEKARVAALDVSGDLALKGAVSGSTLTGGLTVDRGAIYIPDLIEKQVISLEDEDLHNIVDTTVFTNRTLLPKVPPKLVQNLVVTNVQVRMGDDVWLRSPEANINLGGALNVTVARGRSGGRFVEQPALAGDLFTNRGTYRLNLGIVQRTFVVENGRIKFFGQTDFNPELDINALHTVRQFGSATARPDVRIRVHIFGTLAQPRLELSSADSLQISSSDLLSYLVTGGPSFTVGGGENSFGGATATNVLLTSASSYVSDLLRGNFLDFLQFQTAADQLRTQRSPFNQSFRDVLLNTRVGLGKQLNERTFVSLDAGLCALSSLFGGTSSGSAASPLSFSDQLGFKVEERLNAGYGFSFGLEPPTDRLGCDQAGGVARTFPTTPRQFGIDLFKTWRF